MSRLSFTGNWGFWVMLLGVMSGIFLLFLMAFTIGLPLMLDGRATIITSDPQIHGVLDFIIPIVVAMLLFLGMADYILSHPPTSPRGARRS